VSDSTIIEVKKNMKMLKDSKAVSPVIGVMLMLVVTVILAAAVSSTSSGLMKTTDAAPTAVFDVKIAKDVQDPWMGNMSYIVIKEVTGDAIQTENLKIVTTNPNAEGDTKIREKLPSDSVDYSAYLTPTGNVPYWNNMAAGNGYGFVSNNTEVFFGNYTLKPGVSMTAQDYTDLYSYAAWNAATGDYDTSTNDIGLMQDMFADWDSIEIGDFVNVKIVDLKSGKVIFTTDVEVV